MSVRGSLIAKNRRSILVAIFTICLERFNRCSTCTVASAAVAGRPPSTSTLLCTSGCLALAMVAVQPDGIIDTMSFDLCRHHAVGNTVNTGGGTTVTRVFTL